MKHSCVKHFLALFSSILFATSCAVPSVDVIPRYGQFDLDGHFGVQDGGTGPVPVTDLSTAGFGKDDGYIGGRVDVDLGSPMISFSTQQTNHSGRGVTTVPLSASGGAIPADTDIDTDMDFGLHQLSLTFDLVPTDWIDAGIGLGLAVVDVDATLEEVGGTESVTTDQTLPIPQLAGHLGVELGDFEATGLISGFQISTGGDELSFIDLDLMARYRLFGGDDRFAGSIGLGFRSTKLSIDYEDDGDLIDVAFRFNGPYVAFLASF